MKKKIAAALAATFALGVTSAFAANPFSDVPAKHWAYESVSKLQKAGIVEGYSNGQFGGEKSMTRYEMAIVVAKAMTKLEKADAEQKASINKLAAEFGSELKNLGVRVEALEKNQPNVKFKGDFQMRYTNQSYDVGTAGDNRAEYRLRLDGTATVDDKTSVAFRFVTREPDKTDLANTTWQKFGENGQSGSNYNNIDRINITTKFDQFNVTVGRQAFWVDAQGAFMDSGAYSFDGMKAATKAGQFDVTATYGRFLKDAIFKNNNDWTTAAANLDVMSLMLGSKMGKLDYSIGYYDMKNFKAETTPFKWWVANTNYKFDDKLNLNFEYLTNRGEGIAANTSGKNYWAARATYGDLVLAKRGDSQINVQYVNKGGNSLPNAFHALGVSSGNNDIDFKQWNVEYKYAFSKTFIGTLQYAQNSTSDDTATGAKNKLWRVVTQVMF